MVRTCVVHLASGSLGPDPTAQFARSLRARDAGIPYRLLVVFNGMSGPAIPSAFAPALDQLEFDPLFLPERVLDLEAYRLATVAAEADVLCFMNSGARVLADGWLRALSSAATDSTVGLAGASGSWESAFSSAPLSLRLQRFQAFKRFPNPHLRTNAFTGQRELLMGLAWPRVSAKLEALKLESGRRGITRQVLTSGLRAVVVGRDGCSYDTEQWLASATFRSGSQRNLLVADNRTEDYERADPNERLRLARMSWGRRAAGD